MTILPAATGEGAFLGWTGINVGPFDKCLCLPPLKVGLATFSLLFSDFSLVFFLSGPKKKHQ